MYDVSMTGVKCIGISHGHLDKNTIINPTADDLWASMHFLWVPKDHKLIGFHMDIRADPNFVSSYIGKFGLLTLPRSKKNY